MWSASALSIVRRTTIQLVAGIVLIAGAQQSLAQDNDPPPGEYRILNGRVDAGTYTGWRIFHSACHVCHGKDAIGSSRAPNLVESIETMTPRVFARKVLRSYGLIASLRASTPSDSVEAEERLERALDPERNPGNEVSMPAWGEDKLVRPHVLDLYAYLTARANGLRKGEPKLIKPAK